METEADRSPGDVVTDNSPMLYAHLHPAAYSLLIYQPGTDRIETIRTRIATSPGSFLRIDDLKDWFDARSDLLNVPYSRVRICVHSLHFHLLNDAAMGNEANFTALNHTGTDELILATDRIRDDLFVQFGIPRDVHALLNSHFEPDAVRFGDRGLLQLLAAESDLMEDGLYCQILDSDVTCILVTGGRFTFFNKYRIKDREDLLYYVLLCYQSFDLDPETDPLFLCGLIESGSPMYELLHDYIGRIEFMELPGEVRLPDDTGEAFRLHYFINLLSIR